MSRTVVHYANITTTEGREEFIRTTGMPTYNTTTRALEGEPITIDDVITSMPLPEVENVQTESDDQPQKKKRCYVSVSQQQRNLLQTLWLQHGENWDAMKYSAATGIRINYMYQFLTKLRKKQDISLRSAKRGRRCVITPEYAKTIVQAIEEDNTITLKQMKVVLENKAGVRVSTSTISRYFAMPSIYTSNVPSMIFKRVSHRAPNANSDENKELRIKKVIEQATAIREGNLETYVDESAVEMTSIRNYGWAPPNVKAFDYHRRQKVTKLTAVTFISRNGVEYCQFIEGNVTEEVFRSIFQNFCTEFGDRRRVFIMDNARVHHSELVQLANASGHKLCFVYTKYKHLYRSNI